MTFMISRKAISAILAVMLLIIISVVSSIILYLMITSYMGEMTSSESASSSLKGRIKIEGVKVQGSRLIIYTRNIGNTRARIDKVFIEEHGVVLHALDVEGGVVEIAPGDVEEVVVSLPESLETGSYAIRIGSITGVSSYFQFNYYGSTGVESPQDWLQGWKYRRGITIIEMSGNDLLGYQIRIVLTPDNFDYTKARRDGGDIRFTSDDGITLLPYWIEKWVQGGDSILWIKIPEIPANGQVKIYMYYGNPSASSLSSVDSTFDDGILMHTRHNILGDPKNLDQQRLYWEQAKDENGYGWRIIGAFDKVSNHGTIGGVKTDIAFRWWCIFYADEEGVWNFRYGPDAGLASSEFVDGNVKEQTYNDRWWSYNWNDPDIIYFSAYLEKGWHTIEILAFEGCCDGGQSLQFKSPSDSTWKDFSISNLPIKTCKYTSPEPTVIIGSEEVP